MLTSRMLKRKILWFKEKQGFLSLYKLLENILILFSLRESLALQVTQCLVAITLLVSNSETGCVKSSTSHAS